MTTHQLKPAPIGCDRAAAFANCYYDVGAEVANVACGRKEILPLTPPPFYTHTHALFFF